MDALEKLGWEKKEDDIYKRYLRTYEVEDREIGGTCENRTEIIITKRDCSIALNDTDWLIELKKEELLALAEIVKESQ